MHYFQVLFLHLRLYYDVHNGGTNVWILADIALNATNLRNANAKLLDTLTPLTTINIIHE
jgi:hypothetical protein